MKKHQVIVIHGGDTFDTYEDYLKFLKEYQVDASMFSGQKWKPRLGAALGENFEVLLPQMPNKFNAKYLEWKIWFDKLLPLFADEITLVGHSLGGMFLAKYLAENRIAKKIRGLFLVAACFGPTDEYTVADFALPESLKGVTAQCPKIMIYHSSDDPVVPFADAAIFQSALTGSEVRAFADRGHFSQADFPELVEDIRALGDA